MINVDEKSLRSQTAPNVYVKKVELRPGGLPNSKRQFNRQAGVFARKNFDGTRGYTYSTPPKKNGDSGATAVSISLAVKDIINQKTKKATWLSSNIARQRINLRAFLSYNEELTNYIFAENIFDKSPLAIPPKFDKFFDWEERTISLGQKTSTRYTTEKNESTGNMIASKDYTVQFEVPYANLKHLTCFVFCEIIPSTGMGGLTTSHSMITVEKIITNSTVVKETFYLQNAQGQLWAGPWHLHKGRPMEGAYHRSTPHAYITSTSIRNFKNMDLRNYETINTLSMDIKPAKISSRTNYMDSYLSRAPDGSALSLCILDMEKILLGKSKWSKVYQNASSDIKNRMLQESTITSCVFQRDRVRTIKGCNSLGSAALLKQDFDKEDIPDIVVTTADDRGVLSPTARYVPVGKYVNAYTQIPFSKTPPGSAYALQGSVRERRVGRLGTKRVFEFVDGGASRVTDGLYQHQLTVKIRDGAFAYLQNKFQQLQGVIDALDGYLAIAGLRSNYDYRANKFRQSFVDAYGLSTKGFVPTPNVAIIIYLEVLDLLTDMSVSQKNRFAQDLYCITNLANSNLALLKEFRSQLQSVAIKFESIIRPQIYSASLKNGSRASSNWKGAALSNQFTLELTLPGVIDSNLPKDVGFNYLYPSSGEKAQILNVDVPSLKESIDQQLQTFNVASYDSSELTTLGFTPDEITALTSDETRYSYITPTQFSVGNLGVSLLNQAEADYTSVKAAIESLLNDASAPGSVANPHQNVLGLLTFNGQGDSKERSQKIKNLYVGLAAQNNIGVGLLNGDPHSTNVSSEEFLGKNNKFTSLNQSETLESTTSGPAEEQSEDATALLNNVLSILNVSSQKDTTFSAPPPANISFNLKKNNNFIDKRIKATAKNNALNEANNYILDELQQLPLPIKKLTLSKENIFADGVSTDNDAQSSGFDVLVKGMRVIEFLDGYENDFIRAPRWRKLTNIDAVKGSLICRTRRYVDPNTLVGTNDAWEHIPVYNEYFILTSAGTSANIRRKRELTSSLVKEGALGYRRQQLLAALGSTLLVQLFRLEAQGVAIQHQLEFTATTPPGAPTTFAGKITGLAKKK